MRGRSLRPTRFLFFQVALPILHPEFESPTLDIQVRTGPLPTDPPPGWPSSYSADLMSLGHSGRLMATDGGAHGLAKEYLETSRVCQENPPGHGGLPPPSLSSRRAIFRNLSWLFPFFFQYILEKNYEETPIRTKRLVGVVILVYLFPLLARSVPVISDAGHLHTHMSAYERTVAPDCSQSSNCISRLAKVVRTTDRYSRHTIQNMIQVDDISCPLQGSRLVLCSLNWKSDRHVPVGRRDELRHIQHLLVCSLGPEYYLVCEVDIPLGHIRYGVSPGYRVDSFVVPEWPGSGTGRRIQMNSEHMRNGGQGGNASGTSSGFRVSASRVALWNLA